MGRVARYKKIKDIDPYSKKNGGKVDLSMVGIWGLGADGRKVKKRSRRSENLRASRNKNSKGRQRGDDIGFDLPPSGRKDEFDMRDLLGSVKKAKIKNLLQDDILTSSTSKDNVSLFATTKVQVGGNIATIPKDDGDEKKAARILNVQSQVQKEVAKVEATKHARKEGESKNAYNKRTRAETRQIIKQTSAKENPEKKLKKKEFLNQKKKNKKRSSSSNITDDWGDDNEYQDGNDTLITGERAMAMVDEVRFGEQAERPPVFRHLPRGAKVQDKEVHSSTKSNHHKTTTTNRKGGMTEEEVLAEHRTMELMRQKIQAQYDVVKMKRRQAGDFHL